jgi:hypothetical protein
MAELEPYEIYAIKYGDHQRRTCENFLGGEPHDGPMPHARRAPPGVIFLES